VTPPKAEALPPQKDQPVEVRPENVLNPGWQDRLRKRDVKGRARAIQRVNLGLALHYPAPFLFLGALFTGAVALVLAGVCRNPRLAELFVPPADAFLVISSLAFLLTGLLQIGPLVLGLFAPGQTGSALLSMALVADGVGCLAAGVALLPVAYALAILATSIVATITAWVLWMAFLNRLGHYLERSAISEAVANTCGQIIRAIIVTAGFWVALGIAAFFTVAMGVLYMSRFPPTLWFLPAGAAGAAAKVAWHFGEFESLAEFALFPTGLPVTFEYVHFIGGLRKILDRET
jgi:hypothetical protein